MIPSIEPKIFTTLRTMDFHNSDIIHIQGF